MTKESSFDDVIISGGKFVGHGTNEVNIGGDVIGRDKVTVVINMASFTPPSDLAQLRQDYLNHLRRTHQVLNLKLPQLENFTRELLLEDVYVPLLARPELPAGETWERRLGGRDFDPEPLVRATDWSPLPKVVPLPIEQALAEKPRVVIIGDPGSGKTTLHKHLALRLAAEDNAPLPILLPLNAYADALNRSDHNLQDFFADYYAARAQAVKNIGALFDSAIQQGQAVILLDGLDEVQKDRKQLVAKVEAFAREAVKSGCKLVVSSRIVGYREAPLEIKDWALYTLLDFDHEAIEQFAVKWCAAFEISALGDTPEARAAGESERQSLLEAIVANPGVERLASNPLLLTLLALIKRQGASLPNRRVELYELYLRTLISAWNKTRSLDKRPVGPDLDYLQTVRVLGPLALWLREKNPTAGLIAEETLLDWLTHYFAGDEWRLPQGRAAERAREFLESVRRYSNLLIERGAGRYGFIHLTFEEMLAARGLVRLGQQNFDKMLAIIRQHHADPAWRETILLTTGVWWLVREDPERAGAMARDLMKQGHDGVLLAGACLEDAGEQGLTRAIKQEVWDALLVANHNRSLPPTVQRDAGFSLGRTGWAHNDLEKFIHIHAGQFLYGDNKRTVMVEQPFAMAKYPVTNLQYKRFIDADGYNRPEFWSEDGWGWRTGTYDSKTKGDDKKLWLANRPPEIRSEPFFWHDTKWNNPLAPVVGVSWFEAEAYCHWLATGRGKPFRLPTEEEWERAARHTDGRDYPWGNNATSGQLNCWDFWGGPDDMDFRAKWLGEDYEFASTTIVGQFPEGNSYAGLSDMSGNVWEWTMSWHDTAKSYRVLRGGGWNNDLRYVRCATRSAKPPGYFLDNFGFRVLSPGATEDFVGWYG